MQKNDKCEVVANRIWKGIVFVREVRYNIFIAIYQIGRGDDAMIAGVNMYGGLQSLYPQYCANRISPVKPVQQQRASTTFVTNNKKEQTKMEECKSMMTDLKYEENTPYGKGQKIIDESLFAGMYVDTYA